MYMNKAAKKGRAFALNIEEFRAITKSNCYYCGSPPSGLMNHSTNGAYVYNGIDRIDNEQGYLMHNVIPCCKVCNRAKREMPLSEFAKWVDNLTSFHGENTISIHVLP